MTSRLPNVSNGLDLMMSTPKKATALLGPPPKTKAVGTPLTRAAPLEEDEPKDIAEERTTAEGSILGVLASQSTAITALVAHLAGGGDAMQDLPFEAVNILRCLPEELVVARRCRRS